MVHTAIAHKLVNMHVTRQGKNNLELSLDLNHDAFSTCLLVCYTTLWHNRFFIEAVVHTIEGASTALSNDIDRSEIGLH